MVLFGSEPTFLEILVSCIYRYVITATLISLAFIYFLFRTKAPLKDEHRASATVNDEMEDTTYRMIHANGVMANGSVEVAQGDKALLETILHGMNEANEMAAQDEQEEQMEMQAVARQRQTGETETRGHVIREVTVRKIFLPPQASYSDVQNAAKKLIGDGAAMSPRKDSGAGGPDFRAAIRNIREASKRLEDDDSTVEHNCYE